MRKAIGITLLSVIGLAVFAAFIESAAPELSGALYTLAGVGFIVFGIWAGILLVKK